MPAASATAAHAMAVSIDGDNNFVTIQAGGSRLRIDPLHKRKVPPQRLIDLLITERRVSTLVGRSGVISELSGWRNEADVISVRCITGRAGTGKTRLAIEACEAAEAEGWVAGFVSSDELERFHRGQNLASWSLPCPVLLVIDYAATSLPVLKSWFASLARNSAPEGSKLRILLLERHADPETGWWADLLRRESLAVGPADLIGNECLRKLMPFGAVEDRRALLAEAMRLAAPLLDPPCQPVAPPPAGENPDFDARLADGRIDNEPLYLLMAGIHGARLGAPAALARERVELADEMVDIETARIRRRALAWGHADQGDFILHVAACITLQNGADLQELPALIREEAAAMEKVLPFPEDQIAEQLCDLLPCYSDRIEPVRPDLIGEAFLLRHVQGNKFRSDDIRSGIVIRAWEREPEAVLQSLVRAAQDFANGNFNHVSVQWLGNLARQPQDLQNLIFLSEIIPDKTLSMIEVSVEVQQKIIENIPSDGSNEEYRANSLNNISILLSHMGSRMDALSAAEEAVNLYQSLSAAPPGAFIPKLAGALNNLSNRLSEVGRWEEALSAAEEAANLYRSLAAAPLGAFMPKLAGALINLSNRLSEVGRREEALPAAEEVVILYRSLAAVRPDAFMPDLALSLNNLSKSFSEVERPEDALSAAEEAVNLYRSLAAGRPDAFMPNLALSLSNLSNCLFDMGKQEEALPVAKEAVQTLLPAAESFPKAFSGKIQYIFGNYIRCVNYLSCEADIEIMRRIYAIDLSLYFRVLNR